MMNQIRVRMLAVMLISSLAGAASAQTTWYVDDDAVNDPGPSTPLISDPLEDGSPEHPFDAIQEGINAAVDGDDVLILDGRYVRSGNKNLDFAGRLITVRSASGTPDTCVINCQGSGRGFSFTSVVSHKYDTVVGQASVPVTAGRDARPTSTEGCLFLRQYTSGEDPNAIVDGLTIRKGYVTGNGGGILCWESSPTIRNCRLRRNTATGTYGEGCGGAISCYDSSARITNCTLSNNTAEFSGGGINCKSYSNPMIATCTIAANSARFGGGIFCNYSDPTITNCLIAENRALGEGGGVGCSGSSSTPILSNCLITGHAYAGGLHCGPDSGPRLVNSILWDNLSGAIVLDGGAPEVSYSDIQGSWPGEGNIDADPTFAFEDDYHLTPGSPCIDTGTNEPVGGLPSGDLDGNPRPLDGDGDSTVVADMGVYEFNPDVPSIAVSPALIEFFVLEGDPNTHHEILAVRNCGGGTLNWALVTDCDWLLADQENGKSSGEVNEIGLAVDVSGLLHGTYTCHVTVSDPLAVNSPRTVDITLYINRIARVPDEHANIQAAIDASVDGDVVQLADGTYTWIGNKNLDFGGKRITVKSEHGPSSCIIDCQNDGRGFYFHSGENADSVIEGLTITNGYVTSGNPTGFGGGGIFCISFSSPTIANCTISQNTAGVAHYTSGGGGIYCRNYSSPVIIGCEIVDNRSETDGGGIHCKDYSSPAITNCSISGNTCEDVGGGIHCESQSDARLDNCVISGNATDSYRIGGVSCDESSALLIECMIEDNGNGGVSFAESNALMINCRISGNTAAYGAGVRCYYSSPLIMNCHISGNNTSGNGGGVYATSSSEPVVIGCVIAGNQAGLGGGVYSSHYSNPWITDCTISANMGFDGGGGVYCTDGGNAMLTNCILWGDSPQEIDVTSGSPVVTYSDVQGGWPGDGNIDADPLFVDPDGPDDDPNTWQDNDYHLSAGSPCIDTGDPDFVPEPAERDIDGQWRVWDGDEDGNWRVDMGADEFGSHCPGDLDGDGDIDIGDLAGLLGNYGTTSGMTPADGDADLDGDVDLADLSALLAVYGTSCD